jgi:hypothetical protein
MITKFIKRILRRDPMDRHTQANNTGAPKRINGAINGFSACSANSPKRAAS